MLDWNTPSIEFYKAAGAVPMDGWTVFRLTDDGPDRLRRAPERPMTTERAPAECWLTDMDGVLVHEGNALPGAAEFLARLVERRAPLPGADQQLDLHPARPRRPPGPLRPERARGVDLDLGPGDGGLPVHPAARRLGLRHRRGRADHRAVRGRLHPHRHRSGLRRPRGDPHLLVRGDHPGDPADRRAAPGSSPPTPTSPAPRRRARCRRPARSRR